jgi:hypothetical protein
VSSSHRIVSLSLPHSDLVVDAMAGASGVEEADAQPGGSSGEEGDPQALVPSGCRTPGVIDGAAGCGLYPGALHAHRGAATTAGSGLSIGDDDPCVVYVGMVDAEGFALGDAAASSSSNVGTHLTVSGLLSGAHLGLQL